MEIYKVISMEEYNKYIEKKEEKPIEWAIEKLPKLLQRKIKKLVDCISEIGVEVDQNGIVGEGSDYFSAGDSILTHFVYSIKGGKEKPLDWTNFLALLKDCKLPKDILCPKVTTDLKRAKRHAKDSSD